MDNIDRYRRAVRYYEAEIQRTKSVEKKALYLARIASTLSEIEEMEDVIKFLDNRGTEKSD